MTCNPAIHHRRSIRLKDYDYRQAGAYFVTICTRGQECLFGEIVNGEMICNEMGMIVQVEWEKTAAIRSEIELDEFVVMPNHFHGIIWIVDDGGRGTARRAPTRRAPTDHAPIHEQFGKPVAGSIPTIVRAFKSAVTRHINMTRNTPGVPVWQRNDYEHIIRNEKSYLKIAQYIRTNPTQWELDNLYPGDKQ